MSARIRLKRGSTTSWANSSKDNKLSYGQPGIEIRAGKAPRLKVGNVNQDTAWASIPYICPDPEIYQDSQIGTSNNPLSNGYFNALTATEVTGNCSSATKLKTERYIDGVSFNGTESVTRFAMCETGDDNGSKTASISSGTFNLITGARVTVRFTYQNTAASPTLNVNSTGAKPIYWHGKVLTSDQYWQAGSVLDFVYIQDKWELIGTAKAIDTTVLDNKLDKSGGTMTGDLDMGKKSILDAKSLTIITSEISNYSTNLDGTYGQNPLCVSTDQGRYELIFGGGKIGGVQDPSNDNDAANKKYVDDTITSSASTTTPKIAGTAAVGSETKFSRGDHVHPAQTTISGNAGTATKLKTARTIRTNLASTSSASFDGSANINPGVTGTLPIANGGTGATTAADACANLGAVKKSGDTVNGTLSAVQMIIKYDTYPTLYFNNNAGKNKSAVICSAGAADHDGGIILRGWKSDGSDYKDLVLTYGNNMVVPISNGGTGKNNAGDAVEALFDVGPSSQNISAYPVRPGIYRTVGTNVFSNLKAPHGNYGMLIIFQAGYGLHIYVDESGRFYWGRSGDSFGEPAKWYGQNTLAPDCYGTSLPSAGNAGRIFFKKV